MNMQTISRIEFDILTAILELSTTNSNELINIINYDLTTVNTTLKNLFKKNFITNNGLTSAGLTALEPYKVRRAILIAAGSGVRLMPITINTPKPLVRVNGKRIIDSLLDAITEAGINEIYIVRGYLSEQFDQLLYKYPNIQFIENPMYNEANNIASVMYSGQLLSNSYILEADLFLYNPKIIKKYHYNSNFLGIPVKNSSDWCFGTNNMIIQNYNIGAENLPNSQEIYQEVGISYWSEADSIKLNEHLQQSFLSPNGKKLYWEQVPFQHFKESYNVEIRPCNACDVIEIDTFNELKLIDSKYI